MAKTANKIAQGLEAEALTANGAKTLATSENALVDLFFIVGASRGKNLNKQFSELHATHPVELCQLMFYARDIRGNGSGERQTFRNYLVWLAENHPFDAVKVIGLAAQYGRWDDITPFVNEAYKGIVQATAMQTLKTALLAGNKLCGKWMSRRGDEFLLMSAYMEMKHSAYRKLLVANTDCVETLMCAKRWDDIDFNKVPSVASARYQKAFNKRCGARYSEYRESLKTGEVMKSTGKKAKVNAAAVFPHDIIRSIKGYGDDTVATAQWDALPDVIGNNSVFPICDTSGSMSVSIGGSISAWDVSVGLGLYVAQRNKSAFQDLLMVFSSDSQVLKPTGTIKEKYEFMRRHCDIGTTNVQAAFDRLLKIATDSKVPQEDMPKTLLIMSDMEFNSATTDNDKTNYQVIRDKYEVAGYQLPKIVFWNLNGRANNVPVKFDEAGTALISGYSPAILKSVLGGEFSPLPMVKKAVFDNEYYAPVKAAMSRTA